MSSLVKTISNISKQVYKMYKNEKDEEKRTEYKKRYEILSQALEQAAAIEFKKNDEFYMNAVNNLKESNDKLVEIKIKIEKMPENFSLFIELMENIDKLLTAILPNFRHG